MQALPAHGVHLRREQRDSGLVRQVGGQSAPQTAQLLTLCSSGQSITHPPCAALGCQVPMQAWTATAPSCGSFHWEPEACAIRGGPALGVAAEAAPKLVEHLARHCVALAHKGAARTRHAHLHAGRALKQNHNKELPTAQRLRFSLWLLFACRRTPYGVVEQSQAEPAAVLDNLPHFQKGSACRQAS